MWNKDKPESEVMKFTTECGASVEINDKKIVVTRPDETKRRWIDYREFSVQTIKSLRPGNQVSIPVEGELQGSYRPTNYFKFTVKDVQQNFSDEHSDQIGMMLKKKRRRNDSDMLMLPAMPPVMILAILEGLAQAAHIFDLEMDRQIDTIFPLLPPELFQVGDVDMNLLASIFGTATLGTVLMLLSTKLAGMGINKLRYIARGAMLTHEARKQDDPYLADEARTIFKEQSAKHTAKQAYLNVREELFDKEVENAN
ncbi:MAG: hypothetical protein FWE31_05385 [Firmicutes bacterium]|nr:hypothetical protein [Bacillota bacterium]